MRQIRVLLALVRLSFFQEDLKEVVRFREVLRKYHYFDTGVEYVLNNPDTKPLMREKPLLDWRKIDVESFAKLPEDSLGFQLRKYYRENGLDPLTYEVDPRLTDEEYFIRRVVQTHDCWHVVTGYKTDVLGEIGISSFGLAQMAWPPSGFYLGGFILRQMLRAPHQVPEGVAIIAEGWRRGKACKALFAMRWEDMFERSVEDIRRDLGIDWVTQ